MNVLDTKYGINEVLETAKRKIWCEDDRHSLFEYFPDFNEWLDSDEGLDIRIRYNVDGLANASKALFASDHEAYNQAFKIFRNKCHSQILCEEEIQEQFGDLHWFERNEERFEQLVNRMMEDAVVPFVGAGLSVDCGFPTWMEHLRQQARTAGIDSGLVDSLLINGQYEEVIEEIEEMRNIDTFIQEVRDAFSKTGKLSDTTLRLTELFTDTIITTNYDHVIEQAYETGEKDKLQVIDRINILEDAAEGKTTIIKLHGDVRTPARCILSKLQYDDSYGAGPVDMMRPIPRRLSWFYRNSNLLFLGCSLNRDRTMQVFQTVKDQMGDVDRPQHFSFESLPEDEADLQERNTYLLGFGITPIWFPKGRYDYIEAILRLARNELRYRGHQSMDKIPAAQPENQELDNTGAKVDVRKDLLSRIISTLNQLIFGNAYNKKNSN